MPCLCLGSVDRYMIREYAYFVHLALEARHTRRLEKHGYEQRLLREAVSKRQKL